MELNKKLNKFTDFLKKYKYVALILLIGIVLMTLPTNKEKKVEDTNIVASTTKTISFEQHLAEVFQQINGVGKAKVLLTESSGEEIIYQTDTNTSASENSSSNQISTVIISGADRAEAGLIQQVIPPKYLGAVVICQGADSPAVRLAITDALSKITGLGSDRISVLKMK